MCAALATREMGSVIHAYRTHPWHGQPLTQRQVARWGGFNQAYVSRGESGLARIDDLTRLAHWARVLSIPAHLLWFAPPHSRTGTGAGGPVGAILDGRSPSERRDEPTYRRDVLRLGGAVTAGLTGSALAAHLAVEPDLMHTALDTGTLGADRLTLLEDTANRLGLLTVTATESVNIVADASNGFRIIRQLLAQRQRTADQIRLVRTAAKLATVMGNLLLEDGRQGLSACWYRVAHHAGSDSGDRYLTDIALGEHAYLPAYAGDPRGVLAMLDPRLSQRGCQSAALAFLWASKARAHAMLGERAAFARAIERAQSTLNDSGKRDDATGIFSCTAGKIAFYEATGQVQLRQSSGALEATDRALRLMGAGVQNRVSVQLERATAFAQAGEISEACTLAADTLRDPRSYCGNSVMTRARTFDRTVRVSRVPAVDDWRDALRAAEQANQAAAGTPRVR